MKLAVMAKYNPSQLSGHLEPLIVRRFMIKPIFWIVVEFDIERRPSPPNRVWKASAEAPIEVEG